MKNYQSKGYAQAKIFVNNLIIDLNLGKIIPRNTKTKSSEFDSNYDCLYFGFDNNPKKRLSIVLDKINSRILLGTFMVDANGKFRKKIREDIFEVSPEQLTILNQVVISKKWKEGNTFLQHTKGS